MRQWITLAVLVCATGLYAAPTLNDDMWQPPEKEALLTMLDHIYNLEFDAYRQAHVRYQTAHPDRPEGLFIDAIALWMRILTDIYNPKYDGLFVTALDSLIDELERFDANPDVREVAEFYINAAEGFKAIMHVTREQWFYAALAGRKAISGIEKAIDGRWNIADAGFGSGLYLYYADIIPKKYPLLKPLLLIYPDGDKKRGLDDLKRTAEKGLFARGVAAYMYSVILYTREKRISEAYEIMTDLSRSYPVNPIFLMWRTSMAISLGKTDTALTLARRYEKRIREGAPFYPAHKMRIVHFRYGQIYSRMHLYDKALAHYQQALEPLSGPMEERLERYKVYALLQMGYIYQRLKKYDQARRKFEQVLDMRDYQNSHRWARNRLDAIQKRMQGK